MSEVIAYCGLYCSNCSAFKKGKCQGCQKNEKATWCKIRSCNMEKGIKSCAECKEYPNVADCKKFNNFVGKVFAFFFKSNRIGSIEYIRENGYDKYSEEMKKNGKMTV